MPGKRIKADTAREIKELLGKGEFSQSRIAQIAECSVSVVEAIAQGISWRDVEGPPPRNTANDKLPKFVIDRILKMRNEGIPGTSIADTMGIDKSTVYKYLRREGITRETHGRLSR